MVYDLTREEECNENKMLLWRSDHISNWELGPVSKKCRNGDAGRYRGLLSADWERARAAPLQQFDKMVRFKWKEKMAPKGKTGQLGDFDKFAISTNFQAESGVTSTNFRFFSQICVPKSTFHRSNFVSPGLAALATGEHFSRRRPEERKCKFRTTGTLAAIPAVSGLAPVGGATWQCAPLVFKTL